MENNPTGNIGRVNGTEMRSPSALPLPGSSAYGDLPQFPKHGVLKTNSQGKGGGYGDDNGFSDSFRGLQRHPV
jgi:hypothetical protein